MSENKPETNDEIYRTVYKAISSYQKHSFFRKLTSRVIVIISFLLIFNYCIEAHQKGRQQNIIDEVDSYN